MMAVLLGLPVVFALCLPHRPGREAAAGAIGGYDLYGVVIAFYYVRNVLPLVALFYATALIADEVEGKTLTYLLTRPIRRERDPDRQVRRLPRDHAGAGAARGGGHLLPARHHARLDGDRERGARPLPRPGGGGAHPRRLRRVLHPARAWCCAGRSSPGCCSCSSGSWSPTCPATCRGSTITAWLRSLIRHRPAGRGAGGDVRPGPARGPFAWKYLRGCWWSSSAGSIWIFSTREYVMDQ